MNKKIILNIIIFSFLVMLAGIILYFHIPDMTINLKDINLATSIVSAFFSLTIIFIAITIFLEKHDSNKTVAWLLILAVFPVVGFILYLFSGRNITRRHFFNKRNSYDLEVPDEILEYQLKHLQEGSLFNQIELDKYKNLLTLLLNNGRSPFTTNNATKVLNNGDEAFPEIFRCIEQATHHIHVESFVIKDDELGRQFRDALIKKAKQGVKVRVLYDGAGSWKLGRKYIKPLEDAGAEAVCFAPIFIPYPGYRVDYRNHRKIIIIDGNVGFVGGLNISDDYVHKGRLGFWRDTHLKIEGEAVMFLQRVFVKDWLFATGENIQNLCYFNTYKYYGYELIQIADSGPDSHWESISQVYFVAMAAATEKIYFYTPYLVPNESILTALKTAALGGVDVKLIVPGTPDKFIVYWATKSYFEELLEAGVKIYQYQKGFVHSKVLIVDGVVASVGSANMDIRSFQLDFELNAIIYKSLRIEELENDFIEDIKDSKEVSLSDYKNRNLSDKFKESVGRLLSPLL
ncbi:Cardiolipin synthase, bacterial type ClsA [Candidatus Syntrophocurvum alkaliphilum]|uniref:Cardiolipin synthase n=1 Tax=Candidatus Syntrophocurvum alkaliphilum TaxID=2293317 RepID=A0A6I6D6B7_9FIRM|nr:cardiolipin synthase [Candidatus Syntrophocurvum alkaliphilum]QGT98836.1 Cardiolipin synthase, bacterial type ClsA [Candidatus Syntrophocurvum alkaliphilum]